MRGRRLAPSWGEYAIWNHHTGVHYGTASLAALTRLAPLFVAAAIDIDVRRIEPDEPIYVVKRWENT